LSARFPYKYPYAGGRDKVFFRQHKNKASMPTSLTDIIHQADALYSARALMENVRASIPLLNEAATETYEAAWRLGRAHFFLGQEAKDKRQARESFQNGIKASERAVHLAAARVEGHFWLGVNLALLAQKENILFALTHALRAKKALERAVEIDRTYHAAGPLRVLARLQHKLPRALGGGHTRACLNFEQAVKLAPANTVTRIYFAELLTDIGDKALAHAHLEAVLHAPTDPAWKFEADRDRNLAQEKLTGMDRI
jgi:hypothetical protein